MEIGAASETESSSSVGRGVGVVLIVAGLGLGGWTFQRVVELLAGEEVGLIERLVPISRAARSLMIEGQQVEMPASLFEIGAYGMAIGLLSIAATLANALIRGGAALLRPHLGRQVDRLRRDLLGKLGRDGQAGR